MLELIQLLLDKVAQTLRHANGDRLDPAFQLHSSQATK